jgi:hypothetical protein
MNRRPAAPDRRAEATNRPAAAAPNRRATRWIVAGVVVVILVAAVVAFAFGRSKDDKVDTGAASPVPAASGGVGSTSVAAGQALVQGPVTVGGTALAELPSRGADPAVGQPLPTLQGANTLDGSPLQITNDGKAKLIFVVAHWCPHCQNEVPVIQKWIDGGGVPAGLELYAVSTAARPDAGNYPPAKWLTQEHWTVPTLADSADNRALNALGVSGFPFFVAVGRDGTVVARTSGEQPVEEIAALAARLVS